MERRLAAILAADMVGYSRLMAADEAGTLVRQNTHRKELIDPRIAEYGGRLVKSTGDGVLVTFDSPSDGIACTSELTRALAREQLTIRAGLHAGEVEVREDGDVTGLCVNLAARVQEASREGSTYVSSTVRDLLLGGDLSFEDRGEHTLKGIDGAWRLYEHVG